MKATALLIVDPQAGFCDLEGSLASVYGSGELKPINQVMERLAGITRKEPRNFYSILITSEYTVGQHTDGDRRHPLANLCVPNINRDCQLSDHLTQSTFDKTFIKTDKSALTSKEFRNWLDNVSTAEIKNFIVCGVLLEHCVRETAVDLKRYLPEDDIEIIVCKDLAASRSAKYHGGEKSVVEENLDALRDHGVKVKTWKECIDLQYIVE